MEKATIAVNSYLGALLITVVAGGATLIITHVANNVAYADYAVVNPEVQELLAN